MITASATERILACPSSEALPQANLTSEWAEMGQDGHAVLEARIASGEAIPGVPAGARAEVAFAFDVVTGKGRELGTALGRDYSSVTEHEIPGTADVVAVLADRVVIIDWKLGWATVTAPGRNPQLLTLALAAARAYGKDVAEVGIGYARGDGEPRIVMATVDALDLDAHAARLRDVHARVAAARQQVRDRIVPNVAEGPWCKHCNAVNSCPAKVALIRRLTSGAEADEMEMLIPLDAETARIAYERLGYARQLLKRIERAIYARAAESPIALGDGRFLGKHTKEGNEVLDGDAAWRLLRDNYSQELADDAVERKATKSGVKAALKKHGLPIAPTERAIYDELRTSGAIARTSKEEVGEFTDEPHELKAG